MARECINSNSKARLFIGISSEQQMIILMYFNIKSIRYDSLIPIKSDSIFYWYNKKEIMVLQYFVSWHNN
jgi:hypothetical protein